MWRALLAALTVSTAACSTQTFRSEQSSQTVASCIADRWRHGVSDSTVPVDVKRNEGGYLIGAGVCGISCLPSGGKHSTYPVWAEVSDSGSGSVTEYHRAMQIFHERIDKAVEECQGKKQ